MLDINVTYIYSWTLTFFYPLFNITSKGFLSLPQGLEITTFALDKFPTINLLNYYFKVPDHGTVSQCKPLWYSDAA